jgi:L-amino acid N-acyltransferase YncA
VSADPTAVRAEPTAAPAEPTAAPADPSAAPLVIRDATADDLDAILAIYNDAIVNGTALWLDEPVDLANRAAWLRAQQEKKYPVLVAEIGGTVVGYASYGLWREYSGFRNTLDDSIYLVAGHQGRGIGSALLGALIAHGRAAGFHVMIADIESGNLASIALHQKFGFATAGVVREVGTKFGSWLDLTVMRLEL